jgi:hypothetical protein
MRPSPPLIDSYSNYQGVPGSLVLTSFFGTGLETVMEVRFSGAGVRAHILGRQGADTIDVAISVAADAAFGPRGILLLTAEGLVDGKALFYVLAPSGYTRGNGIGSHLI